jgi:hypothetical protein
VLRLPLTWDFEPEGEAGFDGESSGGGESIKN